jgi:YD repeat-containing protein
VRVLDANRNEARFAYEHDRLVRRVDAEGVTTHYAYDAKGNLVGALVTRPLGCLRLRRDRLAARADQPAGRERRGPGHGAPGLGADRSAGVGARRGQPGAHDEDGALPLRCAGAAHRAGPAPANGRRHRQAGLVGELTQARPPRPAIANVSHDAWPKSLRGARAAAPFGGAGKGLAEREHEGIYREGLPSAPQGRRKRLGERDP